MVKVSFGRPCHVPPCLINEEGGSSSLNEVTEYWVLFSRWCEGGNPDEIPCNCALLCENERTHHLATIEVLSTSNPVIVAAPVHLI